MFKQLGSAKFRMLIGIAKIEKAGNSQNIHMDIKSPNNCNLIWWQTLISTTTSSFIPLAYVLQPSFHEVTLVRAFRAKADRFLRTPLFLFFGCNS